MARSQRVTLRDVADRLGLSANTVSRALTGKDQVSESTRALIVAEAKRLGYVPNSHARSLVSGRTMVIGLVITNPSNTFYAALISAVERQCRAAGYSVLLLVTEDSDENEERAVQQLLRFGVDGVLGVATQSRSDVWDGLIEANIPVVQISRDIPGRGLDFVGIDVESAIADAVVRVARPGVRRIWLLEEDLRVSTVAARIAGFRRALDELGIAHEHSLVLKVPTRRTSGASLPWRPDDAYALAANLITPDNHPDLMITANDYFALGVYRAVRECGLAVPDDVRVLGYGDHPFAAYLQPALTTIRLPADEAGTAAVDLLLRRIAEPDRPRTSTRLPAELIERRSTG
ncbi:LacI family DNA-binding transcriptional regulator [Streptosporangium pseudovulgare]|uniref:LacI family transcriptional regulator n=1 Tax=Streptosporangium pseudovulgare TaxID=35765 RepID=A0ABQ2RNR4_9ACTN|nr:LacI family DNA-binding transcriptional regulator [Streptosporangium pseudovulgare]GGQ35338.1 LacI family transcriptional regulator [Streptosporangium pseudovulgare]